jgi:hypothetical protein
MTAGSNFGRLLNFYDGFANITSPILICPRLTPLKCLPPRNRRSPRL